MDVVQIFTLAHIAPQLGFKNGDRLKTTLNRMRKKGVPLVLKGYRFFGGGSQGHAWLAYSLDLPFEMRIEY